jgi:hypothetical protein
LTKNTLAFRRVQAAKADQFGAIQRQKQPLCGADEGGQEDD